MKRAYDRSCNHQEREQANPQPLTEYQLGKSYPGLTLACPPGFLPNLLGVKRTKEPIDMVHMGQSPHVAWRGIQKLSIEDGPQLFLVLGLLICIIKNVRIPLF